MEETDRPQITI